MIRENITAIIVDDEPGCVSNLKHYLSAYCPRIEVVGTGNTTTDVLNLVTQRFNVAFLDIEISKDNIFNILSRAQHENFDIVFVTAYDRYALHAFDVDVLDYILKPLRKKDILNCYNKILRRFQPSFALGLPEDKQETPAPKKNIVLKQGEKVYVIGHNDIIYFEAHGIYTNIHFHYDNSEVCVTVSKSLSQLEAQYPHSSFFRVHRSFLINTLKIKSVIKKGALSVMMRTGKYIPIAKRRASEFLSSLNP